MTIEVIEKGCKQCGKDALYSTIAKHGWCPICRKKKQKLEKQKEKSNDRKKGKK